MDLCAVHPAEHIDVGRGCGELTRSRKLRRAFLEERYADLVEAIYGGDDSVDLEIAVTYQDGRRGVLRVHVAVTDVEGAPRTARKQRVA